MIKGNNINLDPYSLGYYMGLKIDGMHYVRTIKDKSGSDCDVVVVNNRNKPVKSVYRYLRYLREKGYEINSLKRFSYDLCYFLDFMLFNNLTEELIDRSNLIKFANPYLLIINPKIHIADCIEKSMMKKVPILLEYSSNNVSVLFNSKTKGLKASSLAGIVDHVKDYLCYLANENIRNIAIDKIFKKIYIRKGKSSMFGRITDEVVVAYSIDPILKAAKIPKRRKRVNPIGLDVIFENDEMEAFFKVLKNKSELISYRLLFNLLDNTGLRIGEALGIYFSMPYKLGNNIDFTQLEGDLKLISDKEDIWQVNVVVRPDAPSDLQIKFRKERTVEFTDSSKEFRMLLEQYIRYRAYLLKTKKKQHEYLFINRYGNRLKYGVSQKTFNKILDECGLGDRRCALTIHSFRHGFASRWIKAAHECNKDVDLILLAEMLGHSSEETTKKIYYHLLKSDKDILRGQMEKAKSYYLDGEEE